MLKNVAIDAMGGDHGPSVTVPAALKALELYDNLSLTLVGQSDEIMRYLIKEGARPNDRIVVKHTTQVVAMDEQPSFALRGKKDSSMRVALNLLKAQEVDAVVSAGNTGALMAIARFVLKMIPGIDRPAIIHSIPTKKKPIYMLDLGANVDCTPEHLLQFGIMGSVLCEVLDAKTAPKVGLLNIGSEAIKGSDPVKKAAALLQENPSINYVGYVEGDEIFHGETDVVVTDGFIGNVAIKCGEGLARMIFESIKREYFRNWFTKLCALITKPILKRLYNEFNPSQYNGASLLGLQGIVIKSHGNAHVDAFLTAIKVAVLEVENNLIHKITSMIQTKLQNSQEQ